MTDYQQADWGEFDPYDPYQALKYRIFITGSLIISFLLLYTILWQIAH